ncbi:MAG: hypothetical protein K1Y36_26185 [Blastocatellia bacterium]|nr:hypothetical protein [Blastocatellia bacterium]
MTRHLDPGHELWDFTDEILVECPKCQSCSKVLPIGPDFDLFRERRLACHTCGYGQSWSGTEVGVQLRKGKMTDPYLGQVLWLQASVGDNLLWALNHRHLNELESLVAATLRQRRQDEATGWSNRSMASRLPQWLLAAGNRSRIVKVIRTLRVK